MTETLLTTDDQDLLLNDEDLFIKPQKKNKILMLSDHPLAPSGVGVQARFLAEGLIATGKYSFRCLGGAIRHANYDTAAVNSDFIIKPVDGFGTKEMVRSLLYTERPDALLLFTDPRQFIWLWEMEDEIHQICPITYWHVWDNDPYPEYNYPWFAATDLINCLSYKTYEMVKPNFSEKTNYIPHAFPKNLYFPFTKEQQKQLRIQNFGNRADWFTALWVNRNATRKMPADLLDGWKMFLDRLEAKYGHRNATLIMHTDPHDPEGPNLLAVSEALGLSGNVWFSTEKLGFEQMNIMHNITDTCINIAKNEGFGLSTLITMMVGKPIIALCTGGETRQVIDHRDGTENGVAIQPSKRCLVGSQLVPYIYEDLCTQEQTVDALMKIYEMSDEEKDKMKTKVIDYSDYEFNFQKMISEWDETLSKCIAEYKEHKKPRWAFVPLNPTRITLIDPRKQEANVVGNSQELLSNTKEKEALVEADKVMRTSLKSKKIERKQKNVGESK